jgi:HAE1 family hydrophobic/amphiphilic exporter-1
MTTLATLLGFLPLAIGLGEGSEVRSPMAITVIGGLAVSTLLTLVVIPIVYERVDRKPDAYYVERRARKDSKLGTEGDAPTPDALAGARS